jgi:hypothetical protein
LKNTYPESVLTFIRQKKDNKVLCLFNFSAKDQSFKITDAISGSYNNYIGENISIVKDSRYTLKPWGYSVLISNN